MNQPLKSLLKAWLPPAIVQLVKQDNRYGFFGDYPSWKAACQASEGYSETKILEKVKASSLKVKLGEAVFERDSVTFPQIQYSYPLLASLLQVALRNDGHLSVLDFGGALGSSYYQCRDFLSVLHSLRWSIVEQSHFVAVGKSYFEDEKLKFYYSIDECLEIETPQVIILSGVIQYMESPYSFLEEIVGYGFGNILIDRTAFIQAAKDRLTVQNVSPSIYPASYPAWFLTERKFLPIILEKYYQILSFESKDKANLPSVFKGFYFKTKNAR